MFNIKKLYFIICVTILLMISSSQTVNAETVSVLNGRTVYTVYTREEFLTEVYNNIMNENCNVLIRMTDEELVKKMSLEMGLRQKTGDYYNDEQGYIWYGDEEPPEFEDIIAANPMSYIQNDKELLDNYGVYSKYGVNKKYGSNKYLNNSFVWNNYTLTQKSDGWYWEFFSDDDYAEITPTDYKTMMDKVTKAIKTLNLATQNDYQRLKTVSDWITSNAQYDDTLLMYTAYDNIVLGSSVCNGYAEATDLMLNILGYKTEYVSAENISHAWDIVLLNNKWYMIDNTWDDGLSNYQYFLYGTETAADQIVMGGILSEDGYWTFDLSQFVNDKNPLADSYYVGNDTTYYINSWIIDITDDNVRSTVGDTIALKNDQLAEVTSSDPSVASIEDGKIVCHKAGRANITRTDGVYVSHYFVLVSDKVSLSLSKSKYTLKKGKSATITPKVTNASTSEIKYKSSDKTVATVNSNGKITAKKKGKAIITIKLGNIQKKVTINVK